MFFTSQQLGRGCASFTSGDRHIQPPFHDRDHHSHNNVYYNTNNGQPAAKVRLFHQSFWKMHTLTDSARGKRARSSKPVRELSRTARATRRQPSKQTQRRSLHKRPQISGLSARAKVAMLAMDAPRARAPQPRFRPRLRQSPPSMRQK